MSFYGFKTYFLSSNSSYVKPNMALTNYIKRKIIPVSKQNSRIFTCLFISLICLLLLLRWLSTPNIYSANLKQKNPYGEYGIRRLPQIIIVGVMKAGTRATLRYLDMHPDVRIATGEALFFNQYAAYRQGLEFYRSLMPYSDKREHHVTVEKSPDYFESAQAPQRIKAMNASVRIVVVLRNPIRRAVSDYARTQRAISEWGLDLSFMNFEMLATPRLLGGRVWQSFGPVKRSAYVTDLERWYDHFAPHQIHIVDGDKLITDPYTEMRELQLFMGLGSFYNKSSFTYDEEKQFYCRNIEKGQVACLGENKGHIYEPLEKTCADKLKDYYEPYNQKLYDLVGKNFHWREQEV